MVLTINDLMERLAHLRTISALGGNTPAAVEISINEQAVRVPIEKVDVEDPHNPNGACLVFNAPSGV